MQALTRISPLAIFGGLVAGVLVDDAIVEIENIVRHIHMGVPPYQAAEEAATEIGTTVIAISMSIVAVFAPVSFMGGIAGQYFKQFGLTVAIAVLVAVTLTPALLGFAKARVAGWGYGLSRGVAVRRRPGGRGQWWRLPAMRGSSSSGRAAQPLRAPPRDQ